MNAEDAILDETSNVFTWHFYHAVLSEQNVDTAFRLARDAVLMDTTLGQILNKTTLQPVNLEESLKFQLLPRNSMDHHNPLGVELVQGNLILPLWIGPISSP